MAISWIVELPHDLGLDPDTRIELARIGEFHGWADGQLNALPRWEPPGDSLVPSYPVIALRFRRARVGIGMPAEATDRCFRDMKDGALDRAGRRKLSRDLDRLATRGVQAWKTVVRISKWYSVTSLPQHEEPDDWFREEFRDGLAFLNRWLGIYALITSSAHFSPVSFGDLPAIVRVVLEGKDSPDDAVIYSERRLALHTRLPAPIVSGNAEAAWRASRALLFEPDDNPFLDALQMLFGAQVHRASGRDRQAVLDAGTGVEMLVSAVIRAVGDIRPSFNEAAALSSPFRGRFEHHLPLALGDGSNPADDVAGARAAWWADGYQMRNGVVHEGAVVGANEADQAVCTAWDLADVCGQLLRVSPDTATLGALLQVEWSDSAMPDESSQRP